MSEELLTGQAGQEADAAYQQMPERPRPETVSADWWGLTPMSGRSGRNPPIDLLN